VVWERRNEEFREKSSGRRPVLDREFTGKTGTFHGIQKKD